MNKELNQEEFKSQLKEYIVFREQHGMLAKDIINFVDNYVIKKVNEAFEAGYKTSQKDYESWSNGARELSKILYKEIK